MLQYIVLNKLLHIKQNFVVFVIDNQNISSGVHILLKDLN